jgi:predicted ATPase/transcriptional regulator with XRE-family HTH domain
VETAAYEQSDGFATLLRRARIAAGLTQEILAERAGSSIRTIQDLERGAHRPQRQTVQRLARALGLSGSDQAAFEASALPLPRHRRIVAIHSRPALSLQPPPTSPRVLGNLPVPLTRFIGRTVELAAVKDLLRREPETSRLVTLVGAGGCGKTRLALRVAADLQSAYRDGVWLAELTPIGGSDLVVSAIAASLGVREQPGQPFLTTVIEHLQTKRLLLVVDNCEHLITACAPVLQGLLRSCRDLQILATSRQLLGIPGEIIWRVPSLGLPETGSDVLKRGDAASVVHDYDAVRLFVERARAMQPDFALTDRNLASVVQICQRLDGIPLAIELAAARVRVLAVAQIAYRLDDRFNLLTGGGVTVPVRQQTLRATVDWSYDLLSPTERALFRRLAVFAGGCTLEATVAVGTEGLGARDWGLGSDIREGVAGSPSPSALDLLTALVDRSLVQVQKSDGEARYFLLDTIRQYAWEKLDQANELDATRTRHLEWCRAFASRVRAESQEKQRRYWLDLLECENANFRAALEWSKLSPERIDAGLQLAAVLTDFWRYRIYIVEGRRHLTDLLARTNPMVTNRSRAEALREAAWLAFWQVDVDEADRLLDEAIPLCQSMGDARGIGRTLWVRGAVAIWRGDYARARDLMEEDLAVAREAGDIIQEAGALFSLGCVAMELGELDRAEELLNHSLAIRLAHGREWGTGFPRFELGNVMLLRGELTRAGALYRQALVTWQASDDRSAMALAINGLSWIASALDNAERAARLSGVAAARREESGTIVLPPHRWLDARAVAHARKILGDTAYDPAWAAGKAMPLEQAIAYAMVKE